MMAYTTDTAAALFHKARKPRIRRSGSPRLIELFTTGFEQVEDRKHRVREPAALPLAAR